MKRIPLFLLVAVTLIAAAPTYYVNQSTASDGSPRTPMIPARLDTLGPDNGGPRVYVERFPWEWNFSLAAVDSFPNFAPDSLLSWSAWPGSYTTATDGPGFTYSQSPDSVTVGITNDTQSGGFVAFGDTLKAPDCSFSTRIFPRVYSTSTIWTNAFVGLFKDLNNYFGIWFHTADKNIEVFSYVGGVYNSITSKSLSYVDSLDIRFVLLGETFSIYKITRTTDSLVWTGGTPLNLRVVPIKHGWHPAVGTGKSNAVPSSQFTFKKPRYGAFGYAGRRDLSAVVNADGSIYQPDTPWVYLNQSAVNASSSAYFGIVKFNTRTFQSVPIGQIWFWNGDSVSGDIAGQVVHVSDVDWRVFTSSWGRNHSGTVTKIKVLRSLQSSSPLRGINILNVDTCVYAGSAWNYDPSSYYDSDKGYWVQINANSSSGLVYPSSYYSYDTKNWLPINTNPSAGYEGNRIAKVAKSWYGFTTGNFAAPDTGAKIYTLPNLTYRGSTDIILRGKSNQVVPWVNPIPAGNQVLNATFDTTTYHTGVPFSHGALMIYKSPRYWP